jgi:hypothetical protein
MSEPTRHLLFDVHGTSVSEKVLSLELAVGLAHLAGRRLILEWKGVPSILGLLDALPVATGARAEVRDSAARQAGPRLADSVLVARAAKTDTAALADFAGTRTVFSDPADDVVHFQAGTLGYYSRIFHAPPASFYAAIQRVTAAEPFAALAGEIVRSLGHFNAAHVLVGDFRRLMPYRGIDYAREILKTLAETLSAGEPLVIATDEPDNAEFFAPIAAHFPLCVFLEPLIASEFARPFGELPTSDEAALEWMSNLVLRGAQEFVGTPGSAFSGLVQRHVAIAQAKRDLFSEPRPFKFTYAGAETLDVPFENGFFLETRPGRYSWNRLDWSMSEELKSRYREWPEAVPEPSPAGAEEKRAEPERRTGPSAPSRAFTMSTSFKSAYVPPQLTAGRDGAAARRAIEREMQAIACELMFGADRTSLIARIEMLGAPPAEAKRIIDTAYNDPLIANGRAMASVLRKRDWLLESLERQQRLWPPAAAIDRRDGVGADEFLERHYSRGRPVILTGALDSWAAMRTWAPESLIAAAGDVEISYQSGAGSASAAAPPGRAAFARFIDLAARHDDGRYLIADETLHNPALARRLRADHGSLDALLDPRSAQSGGTLWIGAARALTPLHHDLVNCLVAQIGGRNRFKLLPAGEIAKLYNHLHVLSEIKDLDASDVELARFPSLANARIHEVTLAPGEILYVPLGWWYQVRSLSFGISVTYTNFNWPNEFYRSYPAR